MLITGARTWEVVAATETVTGAQAATEETGASEAAFVTRAVAASLPLTSAIFIAPVVDGGPLVVNTESYAYIGPVPLPAPTCLVRVWADDATLDALAEQPDVLFVEDVNQ